MYRSGVGAECPAPGSDEPRMKSDLSLLTWLRLALCVGVSGCGASPSPAGSPPLPAGGGGPLGVGAAGTAAPAQSAGAAVTSLGAGSAGLAIAGTGGAPLDMHNHPAASGGMGGSLA